MFKLSMHSVVIRPFINMAITTKVSNMVLRVFHSLKCHCLSICGRSCISVLLRSCVQGLDPPGGLMGAGGYVPEGELGPWSLLSLFHLLFVLR